MAKITITIEDETDGRVSIEIAGDFEKDMSKCSTNAQKSALETLAFMLRNVKDESSCGGGCSGCHGGCAESETPAEGEGNGNQ